MIWCVSHEDRTRINRGAHFGTWTLQGWEEFGMQQCRLGVAQLGSHVTADSEVRVLIDGAWNQAWNFGILLLIRAEDMREGCRKRSRGLNRHKVQLANVVTVTFAQSTVGRDPMYGQRTSR